MRYLPGLALCLSNVLLNKYPNPMPNAILLKQQFTVSQKEKTETFTASPTDYPLISSRMANALSLSGFSRFLQIKYPIMAEQLSNNMILANATRMRKD
jgi:hypothetical protein